ncbi:MAG: hypothetical protein ACRC3H_20615 [Lachnospiraceae bacterium]
MFAVNTYEEIEKNERMLNEKHIIVLLFVRPSLPGAKDIIEEFNYIHYNSRKYCSIYAVGYSDNVNSCSGKEWKKVENVAGAQWYYSDQAFVDFKDKLERRLTWEYSGEIELIVLQSNPEGRQILNFENYLAINVNYGLKNDYIESFPRFMESLVRSSKKEVETTAVSWQLQKSRLKPGQVAAASIEECKKVPGPLRRIMKDKLFYRTARFYS